MADVNDYEEASLADDFEEATYDGSNDDDTCIVVEDGTETDDGERVIKLCFSSLIKFHRKNATIKAQFIKIVQSFVINNTEIAVRASMILHYIVMECIRTNRDLPADFCSRGNRFTAIYPSLAKMILFGPCFTFPLSNGYF
jgi:hypothetical protein